MGERVGVRSEKELCGGESHTLRMKLLHVGKHGTRAKTLGFPFNFVSPLGYGERE